MQYVFGPVRSRRFGTSLGIDLSPAFKQCNFDCLYCELAPAATVERQSSVVSVDDLIDALAAALKTHRDIDVITVTANGEPTLYPHLEALLERIDAIKGETQTLILTNSAALTDPGIYRTLLKFDRVKLSLDAVTPKVFKKIDRPHEGIDVAAIADALKRFSCDFRGQLYIEVLFVHGLNDTPEEIAALNAVLRDVACERIDIGTIDRPPAYPVQGLSYSELHAVAMGFDPSLPVHIASRQHAESCVGAYSEEEILNTLDKRPLTPEDVDLLFDEASKERLMQLVTKGTIIETERSGILFYVPSRNVARKRQKA